MTLDAVSQHMCPACLSDYIERTPRHGVLDHLARFVRWRVYRCRDCKARFYDRRMELSRVMRFEDVREMDGRRIPTRMVIEPRDREGHRTEMRYLSMDFDANVSESTFSLTELERQR